MAEVFITQKLLDKMTGNIMNKDKIEKLESTREQEMFVCPDCESKNIRTSQEEYKFTYGVGSNAVNLSANVPVSICSDCGFKFLDAIGEELCHNAICQYLGLMKPSQIKGLRDLYKLTQAEFAEITRLGQATLSRWERGTIIQNEAYDNYLYLLGFEDNMNRIRNRRKGLQYLESTSEIRSEPKFRVLIITPEILEQRDNFKLCAC